MRGLAGVGFFGAITWRVARSWMSTGTKKRFCSAGGDWTNQKFRRIGANRWICRSCYAQRNTELRNLVKDKRLVSRVS